MNKLIPICFFAALFSGCDFPKNDPVVFDTEKALLLYQKELDQLPDVYQKVQLQRDLTRIIRKDTSFFQNCNSALSRISEKEYRYKSFLKKYKAEDLTSYQFTDHTEAYQLIISRAFERENIYITILNQNGAVKLKILGLGIDSACYPLGRRALDSTCVVVTRSLEKSVSLAEWHKFLKVVEHNEFWDLYDSTNDVVIDGSSWTIEGTKPYYYQKQQRKTLVRHSPKEFSCAFKIGKYLLDLSDEDWGKIY